MQSSVHCGWDTVTRELAGHFLSRPRLRRASWHLVPRARLQQKHSKANSSHYQASSRSQDSTPARKMDPYQNARGSISSGGCKWQVSMAANACWSSWMSGGRHRELSRSLTRITAFSELYFKSSLVRSRTVVCHYPPVSPCSSAQYLAALSFAAGGC